jgi:hypothetical protein
VRRVLELRADIEGEVRAHMNASLTWTEAFFGFSSVEEASGPLPAPSMVPGIAC